MDDSTAISPPGQPASLERIATPVDKLEAALSESRAERDAAESAELATVDEQKPMMRIAGIKIGKRVRADLGNIDALAASIEDLGLLQPVVVSPGGKLVAGFRRLKAAKKLRWDRVAVHVAKGMDDVLQALKAERDENVCRKAMTPQEAVESGDAIEGVIQEGAKAAQRKGKSADGKAGGRGKKKNLPKEKRKVSESADRSARETSAQLAEAGGMSRSTREKAVEGIEAAEDNPEAYDEFRVLMNDTGNVSRAHREVRRKKASEKPATAPPKGKYRVLYADPPWEYGNKPVHGAAVNHYPTMSIAKLCELPVEDMATTNAVLFLWTTSPLLEDVFRVIKAWGFKYKTQFIWDKVKHNMGHYNSVRHELLLICTRGSCLPDNKKLFDSVQSIERTKTHSEKPAGFRKIIETLYTHGRKIELFARSKQDGWTAWGNEVRRESEVAA